LANEITVTIQIDREAVQRFEDAVREATRVISSIAPSHRAASEAVCTFWQAIREDGDRAEDETPPPPPTRATMYINDEPVQLQVQNLSYQPRYGSYGLNSSAPPIDPDAQKKAEEILLANLTDAQREMYKVHNRFLVTSQHGNEYGITPARSMNVYSVDSPNQYCLEFKERGIPIEDQMLAQMLLLQHDEDKFLEMANQFNPLYQR
jgi:hypothetical protein